VNRGSPDPVPLIVETMDRLSLSGCPDASALIMVRREGACVRQAQLTFAMARHAVVDLSLIFRVTPRRPGPDRFTPAQLTNLRSSLIAAYLRPLAGDEADRKLCYN